MCVYKKEMRFTDISILYTSCYAIGNVSGGTDLTLENFLHLAYAEVNLV